MPVKTGINKSEEVRKLHKSGVKQASEIMAKLKARGITVAPAQVYSILAGTKGKKAKNAKQQNVISPTEKPTIVDHAIVFVRSAGGMQKAKELLTKLSLLQT